LDSVSSAVSACATRRIAGAARITTCSSTSHDTDQARSQFGANAADPSKGRLPKPLATRLVQPDWMTAKTKCACRRGGRCMAYPLDLRSPAQLGDRVLAAEPRDYDPVRSRRRVRRRSSHADADGEALAAAGIAFVVVPISADGRALRG
jgi:hypothetical protein